MPAISRALRLSLAVVLMGLSGPLAAEVLYVEQLNGAVQLLRNGSERPLLPNEDLRGGDRLRSADDGQVRLGFARYGFVDLGPDSEVRIERMPHAAFATDLRSVFRLERGYLRMVWKHPQISTSWPIFIYVDAQRASLTSGEYFFEHRQGRQVACVAAGQMAVTHGQEPIPVTLHPQACYRLYAGLQPQRILRESGDWVAIRGQFGIGELPSDTPEPQRPPAVAVAEAPRNAVPTPAVPKAAPSTPKPVASRPEQVQQSLNQGQRGSEESVVDEPATSQRQTEATPATGPWALSVASFKELGPAQALVKRMIASGYRAETVPVTIKGQPWYRVMILGFDSVAEGQRVADELKERLKLTGAWVLRFQRD